MELEKIKDNLFEFIHINGYLDLYNPGNASIPIKTIDSWRKNVKALCDIATKQEKMIENAKDSIEYYLMGNSTLNDFNEREKELEKLLNILKNAGRVNKWKK